MTPTKPRRLIVTTAAGGASFGRCPCGWHSNITVESEDEHSMPGIEAEFECHICQPPDQPRFTYRDVFDILCDACRLGIPNAYSEALANGTAKAKEENQTNTPQTAAAPRPNEQSIADLRRAILLAAAEEVASHWNDSTTMVNQREQAQRSAAILRSQASEIQPT